MCFISVFSCVCIFLTHGCLILKFCRHKILFQFRFYKILITLKVWKEKNVETALQVFLMLISWCSSLSYNNNWQYFFQMTDVFATLLGIYFLLPKSLDSIDQLLFGFRLRFCRKHFNRIQIWWLRRGRLPVNSIVFHEASSAPTHVLGRCLVESGDHLEK